MTEKSYQEAVQVLRERLGTHLAGAELEGRDEMKRVLKRELNYSDQEADDAINAMLVTGQLRYRGPGSVAATIVAVPAAAATGEAMSSAPEPARFASLPTASAQATAVAGWQIGRDESDEPGRMGQVTPS
jgi:hypothetical protein